MGVKKTRPIGYMGGGMVYTVTSQDSTDGYVEFDFQESRDMVANIMITSATDVNVDLADAVISYPGEGRVRIADGASTYNTVAGTKIHITMQRSATNLDLTV